jgi:hypothetical protein
MNTIRFKLNPVCAALLGSVALLSACGGGGSGSGSGTPPTTRVIDGAIRNAIVCLDKNSNGACDADEPSARSGADGSANLEIAPEDEGKFPMLALVGTDAVDADSGAVTTPYAMRTPADHPEVISPLTTLVATQMALTGQSSVDAAAALQDAMGLALPMFADFLKGTDALSKSSAAIARMLVLTTQGSPTAASLANSVGQSDSSGATISAADIELAVNTQLMNLLPMIAAAATDATVTGAADTAAREAVLGAAAQEVLGRVSELTPEALKVVVGNAKMADPSTAPTSGIGGASLDWFTYSGANDWEFRYFSSTVAQDTPDANGLTRYVDNRKRSVAGVVQVWGDPGYTRLDNYFDGSAWSVCPAAFENTQTVRDAQGRNTSLYCGVYRSAATRSVRDISGLKMADIVAEIRAYPLTTGRGAYANWGPDPSLLGTAVFPANSKLSYQTNTQISNPDAYATDPVVLYVDAVANGGTPTYDSSGVASLACGLITAANSPSYLTAATSLEDLAARYGGRPCVYPANASAGPRHEWWGNSTIGIGIVPGPVSTNPYYQSDRALRIGFGSGTSVTYYSCALRASDGSPRNCDVIGSGSYSIEPLGDARVMRFAGVPVAAAPLTYDRSFVERGGQVYFGHRDKLRVDNAVRPNAEAMDALFGQLGLTR